MICANGENKFDIAIRFFLYVLIFWLPYSPAVVESCVIIGLLLWIVKRSLIVPEQKRQSNKFFEQIFERLKCFRVASSPINKPIALFLTACLISVLGSAFFEQSWHNFLTKTLEWFIVYFLVIEVLTEKRYIVIAVSILLFTAFSL